MPCALAFDIGGTFTDIVRESGGRLRVLKRLSAGPFQTSGATEAIPGMISGHKVMQARHATTLFTNAVIERRGARTALIMTAGFSDVLTVGNELRYDLYLLGLDRPEPLVPECLRIDARERMDADGNVVQALDQREVDRLVDVLRHLDVESVAIVFLHAYRNPAHEKMLAARLRQIPNIDVSVSHEVLPAIGEYARASTTTMNAFLQPLGRRYFEHIHEMLLHVGAPSLGVMGSDGGIVGPRHAARMPVSLLESGPAAGVLFAARLIGGWPHRDALTFDMGGTTAKLCLIRDGQTATHQGFEAARVFRFRRGSGLPVAIPVVDLIEIGAGGGSIAWVDARGLVKVGPRSARAEPGPACYGRGGSEPTVTDADLVLGYLGAGTFLGGTMKLDIDAAQRALHDGIARKLGVEVPTAAAGVIDVATEAMAGAARTYLAERGRDARSLTLIGFGGAGPVHAIALARRLGMQRVVVPVAAGAASAIGLHQAVPAHEVVGTVLQPLERWDPDDGGELLRALERRAVEALHEVGAEGNVTTRRTAEMRFVGQGECVGVPLNGLPMDRQALDRMFREAYSEQFGSRLVDGRAEVVQFKVRSELHQAVGPVAADATQPALRASRRAWSERRKEPIEHFVLSWAALQPGETVIGPAIIEQDGSTLVIPEGLCGEVDDSLNVIIDLRNN
jgi:N-methylhydantoinase A/oxoprolinase/acetone carboxylase beta subunit